MQLKDQGYELTPFHPLQLEISIKGGDKIDVRIEKMEAFKIIGLERTYSYETAFNEIPKFWDEYCASNLYRNEKLKYSMGVLWGLCN